MSASKHTPGQLHAHYEQIDVQRGGNGDALHVIMAKALSHDFIDTASACANAQHLVDCWNACEGINPEAVPELVKAVKQVINAFYETDSSSFEIEEKEALLNLEDALAEAERTE